MYSGECCNSNQEDTRSSQRISSINEMGARDTNTHTHARTHTHTHAQAHTHTHTHTHTYKTAHTQHTRQHTRQHVHVHTHSMYTVWRAAHACLLSDSKVRNGRSAWTRGFVRCIVCNCSSLHGPRGVGRGRPLITRTPLLGGGEQEPHS